jgi:ATP synthase protein I
MTTASRLPRPSARVVGLTAGLVTTGVAGAVAATAVALLAGRPQAYGVVVGVLVVAGFFSLGSLSASLAAAYAPGLSMVVALTTYALQVGLLAVVFLELTATAERRSAVAPEWAAGTVIVGTVVWMATLVVAAVRARQPLYDLPDAGTPARDNKITVSGEDRG